MIIRARRRSPRRSVSRSSAEHAVIRRLVDGFLSLALLIPLIQRLGVSWARCLPSSVSGRDVGRKFL